MGVVNNGGDLYTLLTVHAHACCMHACCWLLCISQQGMSGGRMSCRPGAPHAHVGGLLVGLLMCCGCCAAVCWCQLCAGCWHSWGLWVRGMKGCLCGSLTAHLVLSAAGGSGLSFQPKCLQSSAHQYTGLQAGRGLVEVGACSKVSHAKSAAVLLLLWAVKRRSCQGGQHMLLPMPLHVRVTCPASALRHADVVTTPGAL